MRIKSLSRWILLLAAICLLQVSGFQFQVSSYAALGSGGVVIPGGGGSGTPVTNIVDTSAVSLGAWITNSSGSNLNLTLSYSQSAAGTPGGITIYLDQNSDGANENTNQIILPNQVSNGTITAFVNPGGRYYVTTANATLNSSQRVYSPLSGMSYSSGTGLTPAQQATLNAAVTNVFYTNTPLASISNNVMFIGTNGFLSKTNPSASGVLRVAGTLTLNMSDVFTVNNNGHKMMSVVYDSGPYVRLYFGPSGLGAGNAMMVMNKNSGAADAYWGENSDTGAWYFRGIGQFSFGNQYAPLISGSGNANLGASWGVAFLNNKASIEPSTDNVGTVLKLKATDDGTEMYISVLADGTITASSTKP